MDTRIRGELDGRRREPATGGAAWVGSGRRRGIWPGRAAVLCALPLLVLVMDCSSELPEEPSLWGATPPSIWAGPMWVNEPPGFRVVEDRDWTMGLGDWELLWNSNGRLSIVANNGNLPATRVLQQFYPRGLEGGGDGTAEAHFQIPDEMSSDEIYLGLWVRVNLNWVGHFDSGVSKFSHIGVGNGDGLLWAELFGEGSESLTFQAVSQLDGCDDGAIPTDHILQRGRWHKVEINFKLGAEPGRTGAYRVWVNGQKIIDTPLCTPDISPNAITFVRLTGTWGGVGGRKPHDDFMQWGPVRISLPAPAATN